MDNPKIKCPKCGTAIDVDELLNHQAEEKYRKAFENKLQQSNQLLAQQKTELAQQQQAFEEKKAKENELFHARW